MFTNRHSNNYGKTVLNNSRRQMEAEAMRKAEERRLLAEAEAMRIAEENRLLADANFAAMLAEEKRLITEEIQRAERFAAENQALAAKYVENQVLAAKNQVSAAKNADSPPPDYTDMPPHGTG